MLIPTDKALTTLVLRFI